MFTLHNHFVCGYIHIYYKKSLTRYFNEFIIICVQKLTELALKRDLNKNFFFEHDFNYRQWRLLRGMFKLHKHYNKY